MTIASAALEQPKAAIDCFELPCGYLDSQGNLHTSIEVCEMTGEEEEILAAKNMPVVKKMNKILTACTKAVGEFRDRQKIEQIIPDLTQGDRIFLLFAIRRVSLGDQMPFSAECPECKHKAHVSLDLSELESKPMPDPKIRVYEVVLPRTKKVVIMKVLTGRGEEAVSKAAVAGKDVISQAILSRVESLDGKPADLKALKALPLMDRNALRDAWQDREGGVDTAVKIQCPECERDFESEVDLGDRNFFMPSALPKS
jgi:hypothetical protein